MIDPKTVAIKKLEQDREDIGRQVARERAKRQELEDTLEERAAELAKKEIDLYKKEADRHVKALQKISEGRGKYAKIAKDAL